MKSAVNFFRFGISIVLLSLFSLPCFADDFGDISATAQAMYTGNTYHGYAETRVTLQNHSASKPHVVTLVFPNNSWSSGNSINRLSRTVTLAPGARMVVPLLQPPLPAYGDSMIRVEIDGGSEPNLIRLPNANNHMNASRSYGSGSGSPTTAFISRNLDYDAMARVFNSGRVAYTAEMATGEPDASRSRRYEEATWMPDTRRTGETNWLELDYAKPSRIETIRIYETRTFPVGGEIYLTGISGTNILHIPMSSASTTPVGTAGGKIREFSFPLTSEPVKTVRLDFETTRPRDITIDAVEVSGPSGSAWAATARASSDNSAAFMSSSASPDSIQSLRAEVPVSEWSEDWLAYTPFDIIVISSGDFDSAPPAVISALGNYLLAGGDIILFGKDAVPSAWRSARQISLPDGMQYHAGFGRCFVIPLEKLSSLDSKTVEALRGTAKSSALYWQSLPHDASAANDAFRVVENLKIPMRGIVIIMLAFVIVIGPVNIILLNRRKRRTWMLWTIPAISFVTTLIVFAYSLLREGITPDTRISGLTMLDQPNHIAATVGVTAFYCPLTPSGGLHFDYETEVTPLIQTGYGASGNRREVDWTQNQHFWHGWISARVPAHFHLFKSETRRERLQVVKENGQISVVNGLGASAKSLWLADSTGKIYQAENIVAGQKGGLVLSKQSSDTGKSDTEDLFVTIGYTAQPESLKDNAGKYLRPGTYIAVLDGNPFIENALGSAARPKRTKSSAVVYGILDSADTP